MGIHTLYIDESGAFKAGSDQTLGLRLVGGVLCEGAARQHEATLGEALREGLDWYWPPPLHATALTSSKVRWRIRNRQDEIPWRLLPLRAGRMNRSKAKRACDAEATRLRLGPLRASLGRVKLEVVLACEHDLEEQAQQSRYPSMLQAAIERALWLVAERGGEQRLEVVVERGAPGWTGIEADEGKLRDALAPALAAIEGYRGRSSKAGGALALGSIVTLDKNQHPGLTLADFVLHPVGPGDRVLERWGRADCTTWSVARLRYLLGEPGAVRIEATGPGPVTNILREWAIGTITTRDALGRLGGWRASPPQATLAAAAESTKNLIETLSGRQP